MSATTTEQTWFELSSDAGNILQLASIAQQAPDKLWELLQEMEWPAIMSEFSVAPGAADLMILYSQAKATINDEVSIVLNAVRKEDEDILGPIRLAIEHSGLSQAPLAVKVRLLNTTYIEVQKEAAKTGGLGQGLRKLARPLMSALRIFFKYLNSFLKSLAGVFGATEATKEMKDAIEASVDLFEEARNLR